MNITKRRSNFVPLLLLALFAIGALLAVERWIVTWPTEPPPGIREAIEEAGGEIVIAPPVAEAIPAPPSLPPPNPGERCHNPGNAELGKLQFPKLMNEGTSLFRLVTSWNNQETLVRLTVETAYIAQGVPGSNYQYTQMPRAQFLDAVEVSKGATLRVNVRNNFDAARNLGGMPSSKAFQYVPHQAQVEDLSRDDVVRRMNWDGTCP